MDKGIGPEEVSKRAGTDEIDDTGLEVDLNGSRDVFFVGCFGKVDIDFIKDMGIVGNGFTTLVKTVFLEDVLPKSSTDLVAGLADYKYLSALFRA